MNIGPIKALGLIGSAIMAASSLSHTTVASPEAFKAAAVAPVIEQPAPLIQEIKVPEIIPVSKTQPPAAPPAKAPVAPARPTYTYYYNQPQQSSCGPGGCGSGGRGLFGRRR